MYSAISSRLSVTLSCPLDLTLFPMDTQRCKMQLESCELFQKMTIYINCILQFSAFLKCFFLLLLPVHYDITKNINLSFCVRSNVICLFMFSVGYTTDDLQFMWQTGDPVQMDAIALPQFDIRQEDIDYGNCTKFYEGTGNVDVIMQRYIKIFMTVKEKLTSVFPPSLVYTIKVLPLFFYFHSIKSDLKLPQKSVWNQSTVLFLFAKHLQWFCFCLIKVLAHLGKVCMSFWATALLQTIFYVIFIGWYRFPEVFHSCLWRFYKTSFDLSGASFIYLLFWCSKKSFFLLPGKILQHLPTLYTSKVLVTIAYIHVCASSLSIIRIIQMEQKQTVINVKDKTNKSTTMEVMYQSRWFFLQCKYRLSLSVFAEESDDCCKDFVVQLHTGWQAQHFLFLLTFRKEDTGIHPSMFAELITPKTTKTKQKKSGPVP